MRSLAALLALLVLPSLAFAQDDEVVQAQRHNVYLELAGNANRYSFNYERTLAEHHRLRFGLSIWTGGETTAITESELMIPVMYNVLLGSGPHYLEVGGGVMIGVVNRDDATGTNNFSFWSGTGTIGYRHQLPSLQWIFRAGFTPIYGFGNEGKAYPRDGFVSRFGVSIGWAFN